MKNISARIRHEKEESNDREKLAESSFIDESKNEDEDKDKYDENEHENIVNAKACEKFEPRWHKNKPPTFKGENCSLPPDDVDTWTPLSYFKMFWKHDLNVILAEQTNIYSVQKTVSSLNTTAEETEQLIGIQMIYMSIIDFPNFGMYWANETSIL